MRIFQTLLLTLTFASAASAQTHTIVPGPWFGCDTQDSYAEFTKHLIASDRGGMAALVEAGTCALLPSGLQVSLLESSAWAGNVKVRAYIDGVGSVIMWTQRGALGL